MAADVKTARAIAQLADTVTSLQARIKQLEDGARTPQLQNASLTDAALMVYDADGETPRAIVGVQNDGTTAVAHLNGPPPPAPSAPQVFPAVGGLSVAWDGLAADADVMPADFDHVVVHVSQQDGFVPDESTKLGTLSRAGSIALTPLDAVEQYVRLVTISTSGVASDPSATASGTPLDAPAGGGGDTIPPAAPVLSSTIPVAAYIDASGDARSSATVSWTAPTTNADGTPLDDGSYFEVQYHPTTPAGAAWSTVAAPWSDSSVTIVELTPGTEYAFQARAVDTSGNASQWTAPVTQTMAVDTAAPATPSAPTVAASLTAVQVTHHLTDNTGHDLEDDLDHLDVHIGTATDFTPDATTHVGSLIAAKGMIDAGLYAVGTFQVTQTIVCYVKVIAVDRSGNASAPSIAASATALLIDSAHISDLTASKITAGTLGAEMIVGGRIATADSGARAEMNSTGMHGFSADGTETFTLADADGSVSILGQLMTGLAGKRIVINPDNSGLPEMRFYPDTTENYAYANSFAYTSPQSVPYEQVSGAGVGVNSSEDASGKQNSLILTGDSVYLGSTAAGTGAPAGSAFVSTPNYTYHYGNKDSAGYKGVVYANGGALNAQALLGALDDNLNGPYITVARNAATGETVAVVGGATLQVDKITVENGSKGWVPCPYFNGWGTRSGTPLQVFRSPTGVIYIVGDMSIGIVTNGTVIAQVPDTSFLPAVNTPLLVGVGSSAANSPGLSVNADGNITCWRIPSGASQVQVNGFFAAAS